MLKCSNQAERTERENGLSRQGAVCVGGGRENFCFQTEAGAPWPGKALQCSRRGVQPEKVYCMPAVCINLACFRSAQQKSELKPPAPVTKLSN